MIKLLIGGATLWAFKLLVDAWIKTGQKQIPTEETRIVGNGTLGDLGAASLSADDAVELGLDYIRDAARELARTPGMEQYAPQYEAMVKQGGALFSSKDPVQIMLQTYSIVSPAPKTRAKVELWMAERGVTSRAGGSKATAQDLELAKQKVAEVSTIWERVPTWGKAAAGAVVLILLGGSAWYFMRRRRSSPTSTEEAAA